MKAIEKSHVNQRSIIQSNHEWWLVVWVNAREENHIECHLLIVISGGASMGSGFNFSQLPKPFPYYHCTNWIIWWCTRRRRRLQTTEEESNAIKQWVSIPTSPLPYYHHHQHCSVVVIVSKNGENWITLTGAINFHARKSINFLIRKECLTHAGTQLVQPWVAPSHSLVCAWVYNF